MTPEQEHRLVGLEPDNPLAFLALLGLLRSLREARPDWRARARWALDDTAPPRPVLVLLQTASADAVAAAAAEGVAALATRHDFGGRADMKFTVAEAREALLAARSQGEGERYRAAIVGALFCDAATKGKEDQIESTPLCLLGTGRQRFLERLAAESRREAPPPRRERSKKPVTVSSATCMAETLFATWHRSDPTKAFRWDPTEARRYALQAAAPTDIEPTTQHGSNRLATIGLSVLPAVPVIQRGQVRLSIPGGAWKDGFRWAWPLWREPASLAAICMMLGHPRLRDRRGWTHLGIVEVLECGVTTVGGGANQYRSLTTGRPIVSDVVS